MTSVLCEIKGDPKEETKYEKKKEKFNFLHIHNP